MIVADHSTTLLSFATNLTVATAVLSVVSVVWAGVIIRRRERRTEVGRNADRVPDDVSLSRPLEGSPPANHGGQQPPGGISRRSVRVGHLRDTLREAVDEEPPVGGRSRTASRVILILLISAAPLVVGVVVLLITH